MARITKTSLKAYFETGDKPSQDQFEDLIDTFQDRFLVLDAIGTAAASAEAFGVIEITGTAGVTIRAIGAVGAQVLGAETTASARGHLAVTSGGGAGTLTTADAGTAGFAVFQAETTSDILDLLAVSSVARAFLSAATTAAQLARLGGAVVTGNAGTVGYQIFQAESTADVVDILHAVVTGNAGTVGYRLFQAESTTNAKNLLGITSVAQAFLEASTTAAQLARLGGAVVTANSGAVGYQVFQAATTAAARAALAITSGGTGTLVTADAGAVGFLVFQASTTTGARNELGITSVGQAFLEATTTAAQQAILGGVLINVVEDTTPQLGGQLDGQGNEAVDIAVDVQSHSGAWALTAGHAGRYLRVSAAGTVAITVPTCAAVPFVVGTRIHLRARASGQVFVTAQTGVTVHTPETLKLGKKGATATLIKVGADEWDLMGNLVAA